VMNYHVLYVYQGFVFYGYGLSSQDATYCARPEDVGIGQHNLWFHQLPIFRLAYSGTAAVSIFFVISGFALSYKPLKLAPSGNPSLSLMSVASSTFRRGFRLILPPAAVMLVTMLAVWVGLFENGRRATEDRNIITEIPEHHAERMETFFAQALDWCHAMGGMINVFSWKDFHPVYDVHLWTIATELRCSLALFLVLPVVVRMKTPLRYGFEIFLVLGTYLWGRWDLKLFFAGMIIADLSLGLNTQGLPTRYSPPSWIQTILKTFILLSSLHLLSAPDFCISNTPGYTLLGDLIPSIDTNPVRFWPGLGAMLLVSLIAFSPSTSFPNRFFNHPVIQYPGKLSFSLYIVHGPILHTLGYWLWPAMWEVTGRFTVLRYVVGFGMSYMVYGVVFVWVSDLVWRSVDLKAVRAARWVEGLCFLKEETGFTVL
jgi:peptidoglycan/LPS O-acetylase OafA/YrhL